MGQSKIVVFRALSGSEEAAQRANAAFEGAYEGLIADGLAKPIDGAALGDTATDVETALRSGAAIAAARSPARTANPSCAPPVPPMSSIPSPISPT